MKLGIASVRLQRERCAPGGDQRNRSHLDDHPGADPAEVLEVTRVDARDARRRTGPGDEARQDDDDGAASGKFQAGCKLRTSAEC